MKKSEKLAKLLVGKPSYDRDKAIREHTDKFILKSGINRRLFDSVFQNCGKKHQIGKGRRQDE